MRRHLRSLFLAVPVATALAGMASCSAPAKGGLVLAISTDMQAPKDVNVVSVFITSDSVVKFDYLGQVLPTGTVALPATLAVVEPDNPNAEIRIRVTAFQGQRARVMRDVVTTVPHERTSLLRLPLNLLDDGDVTGTLPAQYLPDTMVNGTMIPDGDTNYSPIDEPNAVLLAKCDFTQMLTSVNGECVPAALDSSQLPDYQEQDVYGDAGIQPNGAPVACFDVQRCFAGATPVTGLSMSMCTFPLPQGADPSTFNVALVTPDTGACIAQGQCFVPLENDKDGGFTISGNTVQLPGGVCVKMMATGAQLYQSVNTCGTRTAAAPVCQPTMNGQSGGDGGTATDSSAQDASALPDTGTVDASVDGGFQKSDAAIDDAGGLQDSSTGLCGAGEIYCNGVCVVAGTCGVTGSDASGPAPDGGSSSDAGASSDAPTGG
jgi:hypothetical protein